MSANTLRLGRHIQKFDWLLAISMLLSSAASLALVYTATYSYGTDRYLLVQACAVVLGYVGSTMTCSCAPRPCCISPWS